MLWDSVQRRLFLTPLQEGTHHKLLTLYYHWQTLSISFLLEMVIAKYPSYISLQCFMYSVTVAYNLTLYSNYIGTHNETIIDNEFLSASIILLYMYQPKKIIVSF